MSSVFLTDKFSEAHSMFLDYIESESGSQFTGFDNQYLYDEEIGYKHVILKQGRDALKLKQWKTWKPGSGKISKACYEACIPSVSGNLLEHRWKSDYSPLFTAVERQTNPELEMELFNFIGSSPMPRDEFGYRFDAFAEYLRSNRLSCKWSFLCYLSFLSNPKMCFPIRSTRFDLLTAHYGGNTKISGKVTWDRYQVLMDLADWLQEQLTAYGQLSMIEIQSYMWVIASLLFQGYQPQEEVKHSFSVDNELRSRIEKARKREETGLQGELLVLNMEKKRLEEAGLKLLSEKVALVSTLNISCGYDICSFDEESNEIHIEVKTTERSKESDIGFHISANEVAVAREDDAWRLFRVRDISTSPTVEDMGNPLITPNGKYKLEPSTFFLRFREI